MVSLALIISKLMNTKTDVTFALKSYLRLKPFISLIIGVILVITIFGIGVKVFEYYNENLIETISVEDGYAGAL